MLGLRCCTLAFSSRSEWELLFVAVRGLLTVLVSLVVEHRLLAHGLSGCSSQALEHRLGSCGPWAEWLQGTWDLSGPRIEPVFPALAGEFSSTVPPGESRLHLLYLGESNHKNPASVPLQILEEGSRRKNECDSP